jgi:hypothetical protein
MGRLTRRLLDAVDRALRDERSDERVHLHAGEHGRPYVCENLFCTSPALEKPIS